MLIVKPFGGGAKLKSLVRFFVVLLCAQFLPTRAFCVEVTPEPVKLTVLDSCTFKFYYQRNVSKFNLRYLDNTAQVVKLQKYLLDYPEAQVQSMHVVASASPEGEVNHNNKLSYNRAVAAKKFLCVQFPQYFNQSIPLTLDYVGENWQGTVAALKNSAIPERDTVIQIINTVTDTLERKQILTQMRNGEVWKEMDELLFPYLRVAEVKIYMLVMKPIEVDPAQPVALEAQKTTSAAAVTLDAGTPSTEELFSRPAAVNTFRPVFAFKTNLLMDAATALNLEIEFSLGKHWSLSLPVYYNPIIFSKKWTLKTLSIQPEGRYWFKESMKGHFVGLHVLTGYYNFYSPGNYRYQDTDGKNPCIGGGISYGYSASLSKHWALEFTVGVGYVYFDYDRFYNVDNGKLIDTKCTHYFGPTKAGITLVYKLFGKEKMLK